MSKKWAILLLTLCFVSQTILVLAEEDEFSPWEAWRQGFSNYEKGEQNKNRGNSEEALKYFQRAREYYIAVQNNRPEWNQKIIGGRIKLCDQEISELKNEVSRKRVDSKTFDEPVSSKPSASTSSDFPESNSRSSYAKNIDSETSELKVELEIYKKKYFATVREADELRRESERSQSASREVENMLKEKGILQQQLSLLQQKYDALNEKLTQPDIEKNELKNRLLEDKMQMELLNQKLKMQDENYEKIRREMAELYKSKTESKFASQQSEQKIRELNDQILRYEKDSSDRNAQIRNLNSQLEQLNQTKASNLASIKEKDEEISKKNKWIEELQEKGGSQNKMNSEVINENKAMREKFDSVKNQNDKLAQENQELKNKQLELHISFGQLKDTVKLINDQKNNIVNEYNNLTQKYNQSILEDGDRTKEIQNLREQNSKLERELKLFVDKYEKTQKRLEERSANEYQTVLAVNKTNSELTEKLSGKSEELAELNVKYEKLDKANRDNVSAFSDLKAKMHALNAENSSLKEDSQNLAAVKSEVQTLQQDSQSLRKEKAGIAEDRDKYQTALNSATKEIAALKKELESASGLSAELQDARKQNQAMKSELSELRNASKMNDQIREELKAMTALKDENQQLNEQLAKSRSTGAELKDKYKKLTETADSAQQTANALELEKKNLQLLLEEEKQALSLLKQENKKTLANQQQIQDAIKESAKNDKDKISSLSEINKRLADALEKTKSDSLSQEQTINSLKSENTALQETKKLFEQKNLEVGKLQEKSDKLGLENSRLLNEIKSLANLKQTNDDLLLKVKDLAAIRESNKKLNESYQQAIEKIKSFTGNSPDEMNSKLVAMLSKSKTENQELAEKITNMQRDLSALAPLKKQISEQKQLLEEYKDKYQKLTESSSKVTLELAKLEDLKNANSALNIKNKAMTALQDDYRKLQSSYQQALQSISAYQQSDKNKLASLDELNKKLTGMLDKSKNEKLQLQQDIEALRQANMTIPALKNEISTLKSANAGDSEVKKNIAAQITSNEALKEQLSSLESAISVLKKQISERDSVISDLKTRISDKSPDSNLSEKYSIAENKINILSENLKESRRKIKSLETQLADKKTAVPEIRLTAPAASAAQIQELLNNGVVAEKKQDIEVALWHFQMVLESEPANQTANWHLGKLYLQTEDYDKAAEHLARAIKADSKNNDIAADYGFALIGVKQYDQAAETFKKINKIQPDSPKAKFGLACALQGLGDLTNSEKEFRAALKIRPDSVEIIQRLALLLAADKTKNDEAAELYRKSRKLGGSPEPELEKLLGGKLMSANNEAVSFLRQAADDAEKSKDWGSAAWYYSQLIDLEPDNAAIPNKVGQLYLLQNAPDKALKALKINDSDITALLVSAEAWIFKNNPDRALEMLLKAQTALGKNSQYSRPELLKTLDSAVDLKIRSMSADSGKKTEKVYEIFKQFSKR